jgi:hypothetical protein
MQPAQDGEERVVLGRGPGGVREACLQPVDGLDVVRKHVEATARQVAHRVQVTAEVGRQALDQDVAAQRLERAYGAREVLRAAIGDVVAVHRRQHHVADAPLRDRLAAPFADRQTDRHQRRAADAPLRDCPAAPFADRQTSAARRQTDVSSTQPLRDCLAAPVTGRHPSTRIDRHVATPPQKRKQRMDRHATEQRLTRKTIQARTQHAWNTDNAKPVFALGARVGGQATKGDGRTKDRGVTRKTRPHSRCTTQWSEGSVYASRNKVPITYVSVESGSRSD